MLKKVGVSKLLFLFTMIIATCLPLSVKAEGEKVELEDLLQDTKLTWSDFDQFAQQFGDKTKFQAVSLNGGKNYPSVISAKNAPLEVSELASQLKVEEISDQQLRENYKELFDSYFSYIDEDEVGNKYLLIIDQPVKVTFKTNVDLFNVTVDSKPTQKIQNNGHIELAKGQQYKVLVEADGRKSYEEMIDLRNVDKQGYTVEVKLESNTNWGVIVGIIVGLVVLILIIPIIIRKFFSSETEADPDLGMKADPDPGMKADPDPGTKAGTDSGRKSGTDTREIIYTVADICITSDILESERQREIITKKLKNKISDQVRDFQIILDKIQKRIEEQKNGDFDEKIDEFELRKSRIEVTYKSKSEDINTEIEKLRNIIRYANPQEEIVDIGQFIMDYYSALGNSFLEGYQLYNDITRYKYSKGNLLVGMDTSPRGLSHAEVLQMINEYASPIFSTMISQIKDLQGNISDFSKSLNSIQKTIDISIAPRIQLLENQQSQNVRNILQVRKDLKEELQSISEKMNVNVEDSNGINSELDKKLKLFKEDIEDKLNKINELAFEKLKKYVNDELESRVDSLISNQRYNASELLQMQQQIIEQSKQIELGQRELNELDTKFAGKLRSLKQEMDNKIANVNDTVIQKLKDIVKNEIISRIDSLEIQQSQNVSEILKMRQVIMKQSKQIKLTEDELRDFDKKFETEFIALQEDLINQLLQMHNSIVAKLAEHYSKAEQYTEINKQIVQTINEKCSPEVIHSLAVGRYLAKYQKEILNVDASVVFLAYAKAVEKILNPNNDRNFSFYQATKDEKVEHLREDLEWIRKKRNDAAHTQSVTMTDVNQVDKKLLEKYVNDDVFITELIKAKNIN